MVGIVWTVVASRSQFVATAGPIRLIRGIDAYCLADRFRLAPGGGALGRLAKDLGPAVEHFLVGGQGGEHARASSRHLLPQGIVAYEALQVGGQLPDVARRIEQRVEILPHLFGDAEHRRGDDGQGVGHRLRKDAGRRSIRDEQTLMSAAR